MNEGAIQSKGKVLFLATVPSMIVTFNLRNIRMLQEMGYEVHAACNFKDLSAWTEEKIQEYRHILTDMSVVIHQIDFPRKPWHPILVYRSYRQIRDLLKKEQYVMMHNQSCVSGIIGRIACHGLNLKILHTEHGFYYFKGGPLINWIFYPFDRFCGSFTDVLFTINKEDYTFAKKYIKPYLVEYIPGVGVNTEYFRDTVIDRSKMRQELGIPKDAFVVLSAGELNQNKNHVVIIEAIAEINNPNIYYVICGEGVEHENLKIKAKKLGIAEHLILTGIVKNINEFYKMADIFAFPSKREGLGLAAIEAMASGLPLICSNKNGINDYAEQGKTGYICEPNDVEGYSKGIMSFYSSTKRREQVGQYNIRHAKPFDFHNTDMIMKENYENVLLYKK